MLYSGAMDDLKSLDQSHLCQIFTDEGNAEHVRLFALSSYLRNGQRGVTLATEAIADIATRLYDREHGTSPTGPGLG